MNGVVVVPPHATKSAAPLLAAGGWRPAADGQGTDAVDAAFELVRAGDPVLLVPDAGSVARTLGRIVVVHEGSRGDRAGMDAADDAARSSGAEIIVLHVPAPTSTPTTGSLAFRIADHGDYDLDEWRNEFLRRFCRCSPGVKVTLHVAAGSTDLLADQIRGESPDLVIVSGPPEPERDPGDPLDAVLRSATPVLIVPSVGRDRSTQADAERGQHGTERASGRHAADLPVREVMTVTVVSVDPSTPLEEVVRILREHRVSGAPVVGAGGELAGVITESDLVSHSTAAGGGRASTAADAMSAPAIAIGPDEPLDSAARVMTERNVNRLPVIDGRTVLGIITREDVLRAFAELEADVHGEPERPAKAEPSRR